MRGSGTPLTPLPRSGNSVTEVPNPADRAESGVTNSVTDGAGVTDNVTDEERQNPHSYADVTDVTENPEGTGVKRQFTDGFPTEEKRREWMRLVREGMDRDLARVAVLGGDIEL